METPKAYLHSIQFIFEILANFFEFTRKKRFTAKCLHGQALPPPCAGVYISISVVINITDQFLNYQISEKFLCKDINKSAAGATFEKNNEKKIQISTFFLDK